MYGDGEGDNIEDEAIINQPVYLGGPFVSDDVFFRRQWWTASLALALIYLSTESSPWNRCSQNSSADLKVSFEDFSDQRVMGRLRTDAPMPRAVTMRWKKVVIIKLVHKKESIETRNSSRNSLLGLGGLKRLESCILLLLSSFVLSRGSYNCNAPAFLRILPFTILSRKSLLE